MADRWEVRAAGPSSAPDHGGRAFARRGFAVALCAGLALASVRCFQDLIVEPSQPSLTFNITPESTDVAIGDTVAPFSGTLTANGQPVPFRLRLGVTEGANVVRVDSLGRVAALARGVARLEVRPLLSAFTSDTLRRTARVRAIVPRLAVTATPSVDTLTSLGDTLALRAVALTRSGDTIPGVPIVWRRVSGDTAVTLLDSATGRVRAARNGEAEFVAAVDTATARRRVVVRQVPTSVTTNDSVRMIAFGQTVPLAAAVGDRRGNPVVGQAVAWASLDAAVASVSASGVVTAVANGSARIEGRVGALADTTRVTVAQVARGLRRVSGDGQTGQVGTALTAPFLVEVTDSLGALVARAGEVVRFVVTGGGGKFSGQDSLDVPSGASGRASATLTLPTVAAPQSVSARLPSLPSSAVAFTATAAPAPARTLALVSGNDQNGIVGAALAAPFPVAVQDTFGNAISGRSVTFKVTRGGGKLAGQDSVVVATNAQGRASATLTLGTVPDTNRVTATSAGLVGSPLTFSAVAAAGPVRTLSLVSGGDQSGLVGAVLAEPFVVAAQDTFGNATAGRQIWFEVTRGGGKLGGLDSVVVATNAQGRASTTLTLGTVPDTNRVTATSTELLSSPVTLSAVAVARQAYQLVKVSGDSQTAQVGQLTAHPFVVAVRDTFGNAVSGTVVVFRVVAGGGRFAGVDSLVDTTGATGLAIALLKVSGTENDTTRVAASVGGLVGSPVTFLASSAPIPVAQVVVAPRGASVSGVGATFQFTAEARAASGSVLPGRIFTWASLNPNVATIDPATGVVTAIESGQATISATVEGVTGYALLTVVIPGVEAVTSWSTMTSGTTQDLARVWGVSGSEVYAVGNSGAIVRYNGTGWSAMTSGTTAQLTGVWGTSGSDIYVVGNGGTILRYNGTSWSAVAGGTTQRLRTVWGTSGSDICVVGDAGTILRYNGTSWSAMTSGTTQHLNGLWGISGSDIFAAGEGGTILHYNGTSWSAMTSGTTQHLTWLWGTSSSDIYAVGEGGTILRYNGTSWSAMTSGTTQHLNGLWGTSGSDIYASGAGGTLLRYDGTNWSTLSSGTAQWLHGLWGTSGTGVFAVGLGTTVLRGVRAAVASVVVTQAGVSLTGVGSTTTLTASAKDAGGTALVGRTVTWTSLNPNVATVNASTGVATAVASGQVTIAATAEGITGYALATVATPSVTPVSAWDTVASGTIQTLQGTWGSSATDVYAVGGGGTVLHYDGTAWSRASAGSTAYLLAVWGSSPTDVFVAGNGGAMLHFNGSAWASMQSGVTWGLRAVWGSAPTNVYAVGDGGVLRYDGSRWTVVTDGGLSGAGSLTGVWGSSVSDVFVSGGAGSVYHYDGVRWTQMPQVSLNQVFSLWGTSPQDVYLSEFRGAVIHYDGTAWGPMATSTGYDLEGLWGSSSSEVISVGAYATIVTYDGARWASAAYTPPGYHLWAIWGTSGGNVYAVGDYGVIKRGFRVASVVLSPSAVTLNAVGSTRQLSVAARGPDGTTIGGLTFSWSSSDAAVATVSGAGLVTAVANGTATITATAPGGASGSVTVSVSLSATQQETRLSAGDSHTCGLTTGGAAYCWGSNNFGQLGDGTSSSRTSPVPVVGGVVFGAPGVTASAAAGRRLRTP